MRTASCPLRTTDMPDRPTYDVAVLNRTGTRSGNGDVSDRSSRFVPEPSTSKSIQANAFANAKRGYERYVALAKASSISGDAIETENYYQHAEHYLRAMRE